MAASQSNGSAAPSTNESAKPAARSTPKDALVMAAILREMGISDYEPRVVNQMLEFTYRYITTVLDDAKAYSCHAGKKDIDTDDVQLAIQSRLDHSYTSPPPRDFLIEIARQKNRIPLPQIQPKSGLRLPPDRYCLTGKNYKVKTQKKPTVRPSPVVSRTSSVSSSMGSIVKPAPVMHVVRPPPSTITIATTASRPTTSAPQLLVASISNTNLQSKASQLKSESNTSTITTSRLTTGSCPVSVQIVKSEATATSLTTKSASTPTTAISTPKTAKSGSTSGTPASMMTVSALPSMDETVASAQQPLITPQKRKHDDDDDDYDV